MHTIFPSVLAKRKANPDKTQNCQTEKKQEDRYVPARKMASQSSKEELRWRCRQRGSDCVSHGKARPFEDDAFD